MIKSKSYKRYQLSINIILLIVVAVTVLPLLLLFMSSISSERSLFTYGYSFFPREFSLDAYRYILHNKEVIFRAYGVTILVTVVGTALHLLIASLMAFPLSIQELPYRKTINFFVFFTILFSGGLLPTYLMWTNIFHIKNTIFALIVPNFLMSGMNVLLIKNYFSTGIPTALYEAAQIDGAGYLKVFVKIVLPLGKPILVAVGALAALGYWNDWTNGLYYVSDSKLYSIQALLNKMILDIQALQSSSFASVGSAGTMNIPTISIRMAIAFVALFPVLVLFPFLEKYFVSGITLGAVKE